MYILVQAAQKKEELASKRAIMLTAQKHMHL